MDRETLQALIDLYKVRKSADLLSIILDEAEGFEAQTAVLALLRSLSPDALRPEAAASARRKACRFCLSANEFELSERFSRISESAEDKVLRAQALHGMAREQDAAALYRQALVQEPGVRNRELERLLGVRPGVTLTETPAKVISLTTYSSRRDTRTDQDRREAEAGLLLDDLDDTAVTFSDVAGLDSIKAELRRRLVLPYLKPTLFDRYKQRPGGNLLLYGPPGCGKTLIARATAGETDARFLSVNPDDILDADEGDAAKRLRVFFDEARSDTPSVLFFDGFDILGAACEAHTTSPVLFALLAELDGHQRSNRGVLIIAATNAPWRIDPALYRCGRFQRVLFTPPPAPEARQTILFKALNDVPGADKLALDRVVRKTEGFSGADLRSVADAACESVLSAALAGRPENRLTAATLEIAAALFKPSTQFWVTMARRELRRMSRAHDLPRGFAQVLLG